LATPPRCEEAPAPLSSAEKLRLGAEIVVLYARVRWELRRQDLPSLAKRLRVRQDDSETLSRAARLRLVAVTMRMLAVLPTDSPCLTQSFVLLALLERRGAPSSVVIGVSGGEDFTAHAWLECEGEALLPSGDGKYVPITTI
jgi:hypothetical protein